MDYIEENNESLSEKETRALLIDVQTDYEVNMMMNIYNNVMLEKVAENQYKEYYLFERLINRSL